MFQTINENLPESVRITVVYDNNPMINGLQTDWGFACVLEVGKTKILFDTGDNGNILLSNMAELNIDPKNVDFVFLSHFHHDHTGGLCEFLKRNPDVDVFYPQSFPSEIIEEIKNSGARPVPVSSPKQLRTNIFSLGELENVIPEQSLAINTRRGIVVITGCAHPGIINILEKANAYFPEKMIYLALGGFHLHRKNEDETGDTINKLLNMNILNVAPTHCSGYFARKLFKEMFNNNYLETGIGKVIRIS